MIPSNRWFPTSIAERKAFFTNFKAQFPNVSTLLGLDGFNGQVEHDAAVYQFLADVFTQLNAYEEAVRQYRRIITENDIGDVQPQFPAPPTFALPFEVETGIFERLDNLRNKIFAADNYTDEIGALLKILPKSSESLVPEMQKPRIVNASPAQMGYLFSVIIADRGEADACDVYVLKKGGTWQKVTTFTGKSSDVEIVPTTQGESEQIQVRVQLRKNNQNYGQPSDIVNVTINP